MQADCFGWKQDFASKETMAAAIKIRQNLSPKFFLPKEAMVLLDKIIAPESAGLGEGGQRGHRGEEAAAGEAEAAAGPPQARPPPRPPRQ